MEKNSQLRFPPKVFSEPSLQRPVRWLQLLLCSTASSSLSCGVSQTTGKQKGTDRSQENGPQLSHPWATRKVWDTAYSASFSRSPTSPVLRITKVSKEYLQSPPSTKRFTREVKYSPVSADAKLCKHLSMGPSRPGSQAGRDMVPLLRTTLTRLGTTLQRK